MTDGVKNARNAKSSENGSRHTPGQAGAQHADYLEKLFGGVELAVFAGEEERDVGVFILVAIVDFATVEGLRVDVDADGTLIKFGEVHDLVNRLHGIDEGRMGGV